jgi:hypothetical protein
MSRRLTDEEIAARYSNQYRVETPEAGVGALLSSGASTAAAAALELPEAFGLSRDYRLAQEAEAQRTSQRYYDTNPNAVGSYKNISSVGDVGRYALELGAQSLPSMLPIIGAGLVGGPAAAFGVAGLTGIGAVAQAQREQTGRTDATAVPLGLAYGGVEAATGIVGKLAGTGLRAERAAAVANKYLDNLNGFSGGLARTGSSFARTGLSEAAGEVAQEYISNVGRLAIDPRVELFSPEAMDDYAESFVGGGLLGGLLGAGAGGWRRSQGYREAARERDLTSSQQEQTPLTPRPADSQFVTQDQTVGLQSFINQNVGVNRPKRKDYVAQFKAAYDEPTGQFVSDPETGIERPLTVGEALQRSQAALDLTQEKPAETAATAQVVANTVRDPRSYELRDTFGVIPTPSSLQLYSDIQATGIPVDSDLLVDVWKFAGEKPLTPKRLEKAQQLLDAAIIKSRQEAPSGTGIPSVSQPAGGLGGGSAVVPGVVGTAGPSIAPTGGDVQPAGAVGAPVQQAGTVPVVTSQPSATVTPAAPAAPQTRFRRAPRPMTVLEAANAAKAAQAQQTETQGSQAPAAAGPVVDPRQQVLQQIFGQRNGDIIFDVVGMGMPEPEAAAKYGLSRSSIQAIAGATGQKEWPALIASAKAKLGLSDAQIADAFNTVSPDSAEGQIANEVFTQSQERLDEDQAIEAGLGNIIKTAGASTGAVEGFTKLQKEIDATLEALAVETDEAVLEQLNAKLAEQIEKLKVVEKQTQAEVRALAGKQSNKDAADLAEAKADQPKELGEEDAVQVESPAGVSVQPEAEAGQGVGKQVRRAKKPATEGKAQVPAVVLTEAEQAAQAWDVVASEYPTAPKFADLTKEQQENFIEFGSDNWGKDDVELELTKLARQPAAKVEYPTPPPGAPAYVQPAQRAVVDFMNGDVTKQQLLERFAKLGMTEGQIRSVTNRIDITKDEIDSVQDLKAVLGFTRQSRQTTRLFTTDLYLGKENVPGQPQYGRELRNPVTLNDGTRLDGFTSPDQSVFSGYDRNGQRITMSQDSVNPADIKSSRDSNRTANALKAALSTSARQSRRSVRTTDQDGVDFESVEASLEDLSKYSEGIAAGIRGLQNSGMGNAVDAIDSWMVTFSPVKWDAIYTMVDGKRTIIYNGLILKDKQLATTATLHEVGHGVDEVQGGAGKFSNDKEFKVSRVNGELMAMRPGTAMDELLNHFEDSSETSPIGALLNYPLDMSDANNRSLTIQELREEVFAQVWAFSNMNGGMDYLRDNLPATHAFMEKVHEQVKATNYAAAQGAQQGTQSGQVQAGQQGTQPTGAIFRASRQRQGLIDRNIAKLPKDLRQPVRNSVGALSDIGGKGLDYVVFTSDLVKRAVAAGMPSAQKFADVLARRAARVSELERQIEKIADGYADIEDEFKGSGRGSVNDFLFESTRTGKWGYGKFRDAKMGAEFDKLGPKAQKFVKDVFAHGDKMLSDKKKIVLEAATSEYDAMIKAAQDANDTKSEASLKAEKAATLKRFQTLFRIREGIPYAPIKRNGTQVVIGKSAEYLAAVAAKNTARIKQLESDPDHYHVSFADSKWEARTLKDKLAEQGVFTELDIVTRSQAFEEAFSGESLLPALTKMRAAVDKQTADGKKDPTAGKMLNIINQLYLEALAEGSARKSEMRRRGVAGEVDMLQSFTQQGRADANFLANVQFEPQVQDQLQNMRNESRRGDRERKSEIFNELTQRYADSLDVKVNSWVNGLTGLASKFFLATSPAYYLQNLTQPFMMSLPAMAGRHDYGKAAIALGEAYTELGPLFKDVKLFDQQFDFSKVPADVRTAINELVNQGKIDIGLATEINEYKVEADGKLSAFAQRLNKGMRMAVQKTEAVNRLSTAIAAYRLEYAKTKDAAKATQYAADILSDTHGDYTAFNAPRAFNTQWGKVALQFRKFQLIQIAFYAKLIRDAFTKPDERAAAMKTLAYSLAHTGVFAGLMGMPGYAAIAFVLGLFGDEDEPYDLTADMRKALGPEWADLIMRGAPTLAGVDLSGKIGSGNMLSIMPFSDADLTTNAGRAEALGTFFGGAAFGMTSRVIDGLLYMLDGDYYKGIERVMPKGVSDALKAGRQATEGMTRRNGDVMLPENEIGLISSVLTGLGVPSVQQSVTYERQNRMRDLTENFQDRTTRIKNDYAKAARQKDTAAMQQAREAWTKLQQARQRNGLKPQPVSNLLKAPQEQAQREKRTVGGVQYREGQRKLAEQVTAD